MNYVFDGEKFTCCDHVHTVWDSRGVEKCVRCGQWLNSAEYWMMFDAAVTESMLNMRRAVAETKEAND